MPEISIITPWLDHPEFIADYERAVFAPGIEVIIVDNGSASAPAAAILEMVGRLGGKYLRNEENRWFSAANNQGLAAATGRIVLFMNNDISAESGWLERVRAEVGPDGLFGPTLKQKQIEQWQIDYLEGWCIAAQRVVWDKLGGWNDRAFRMPYWEDVELCWRASRNGISLNRADWPVMHKVNGTSDTISAIGLGIEQNRRMFLSLMRGESPVTAGPPQTDVATKLEPLERYRETGRLPDAERDYRRAVEREPTRADLRMSYGIVLACCGRQESALECFAQAMTLDPAVEADAYREMGIVYDSLHRFEEAIRAFGEVVGRKPRSPVAHCNLAASLTRAGRPAQAVAAARTAVALHEPFGPAHAELAHALFEAGDPAQAEHSAKAALRYEPNSLTAWYVLGLVNKTMGRKAEAIAALSRALQIQPQNEAATALLRELHAQHPIPQSTATRSAGGPATT